MRRMALLFLLCACKPDLEDQPALVLAPRFVAVVAEPPEAAPGAKVSYQVHFGSGAGPLAAPPAFWAYCIAPKPLGENNTVNTECLTTALLPIGGPASSIDAVVPDDACRLFGPDTPPGGFRPRDPDSTGGYYQPLRVNVEGDLAVALQRVRCNLASAPAAVGRDYAARYQANRNPHLGPLTASTDGAPIGLDRLPAGGTITFTIGWPAADAEPFVTFDIPTQTLADRRESMRVSWFATAGHFDNDRTGRSEEELDTTTSNVWNAPREPGVHHVWTVLRDSRGGSAVLAMPVAVVR